MTRDQALKRIYGYAVVVGEYPITHGEEFWDTFDPDIDVGPNNPAPKRYLLVATDYESVSTMTDGWPRRLMSSDDLGRLADIAKDQWAAHNWEPEAAYDLDGADGPKLLDLDAYTVHVVELGP